MQAKQKLCMHGEVTGWNTMSRQMAHVSMFSRDPVRLRPPADLPSATCCKGKRFSSETTDEDFN